MRCEHCDLELKDTATTCPSCVQGLSKIQKGLRVDGRALITMVAAMHLGKSWKKDFVREVKKKGAVERILF